MGFQDIPGQIHWKVHFSSPITTVFEALSTDKGRETFWAHTAERDGYIDFTIVNYPTYTAKILAKQPPTMLRIEYFGTEITFTLASTSDNGTDLSLVALVDDEATRQEMTSGWVSVLLAMKAAVDFGVDLRNHNPERAWKDGYADN